MKTYKNHFGLICRKLYTEQKKTLLITSLGYLGLWAVIAIWSGYFGGHSDPGLFIIYLFVSALACSLVASKMFFELGTKEGRVNFLMTPASTSDQFFPRLIAIIPGMIVLVTSGYLVFGYVSSFVLYLRFDAWLPVYNPFNNWTVDDTQSLCGCIAGFLFSESLFIYGSIAWPKKSFIKTLCAYALLQIVLSTLVYAIIKVFSRTGVYIEVVDSVSFVWSITIIVTILSLIIGWLSFRKLKCLKLV